jgi:uncharacterized protein (TIGR02118 family)
MAKNEVLNIVATACQPEDEERFNKWYNEVHIPMLLKYKGIVGAARYKIIDPSSSQPKYIALYRYASVKDLEGLNKSPELQAALKEMKESWGDGIEVKFVSNYELIQEWGK